MVIGDTLRGSLFGLREATVGRGGMQGGELHGDEREASRKKIALR